MATASESAGLDSHAILQLLPHGVLVVAGDWRVVYANPEASRLIGGDGGTLWERCPELEHTAFASGFRYAMADRTELLSESALPPIGWCQARARPLPGGGLLISLRQVHAHTIEAAQASQALLVGEIGDALTREDSLRAALGRCADAMVRRLDAALVRLWTVDDDQIELGASAGLDPHDQPPARIGFDDEVVGRIAETGAPLLTNEAHVALADGRHDWLERERLIAFAGYPLRIEDRVVGVMAVYSRRAIDHDLLNALSSIASALALGIDRKGADAKRRSAEAELRRQSEQRELLYRLGQQLAAELDIGALAQQIIDAATRLAAAQIGALFYDIGRDGKRDVRHALAGPDREHAADAALPAAAELVAATLEQRRIVRVDDLAAASGDGGGVGRSLLPQAHVVISYLAVPVTSRTGRPIGSLVFGHDRAGVFGEDTERLIAAVAASASIALDNARMFHEAHDLIAALEKTNRELDQFAYVASHDLKAPLRGIANLSQWIEDDLGDRLDASVRNHIHLLRGRVVRLENLIAGILAYSRAGRDTGEQVPTEVGALVNEVWELLSPPATARLEIATPLPQLVTSRTQLQQVLLNLLGNALKYNPDRPLVVSLGARRQARRYEFFVRDDGIGIAPEFHAKIWDLFQTLERRDKLESTGIGLSIVRKIVEARGGRAWVESRPGHGATFLFTWPTGAAIASTSTNVSAGAGDDHPGPPHG